MATTTTRMGLRKPGTSDTVNVTTDLDNNFDLLDAGASTTQATTTTRPSTPFQGQAVFETDTGLLVVSNGTLPASGSWTYVGSKSRIMTSGTRPTTVTAGLIARETDTHNLLLHNGSSPASAGWEHQSIPVVSSTANIVAPYTGQLVFQTSDSMLYRYSGSAWVYYPDTPIFGGYCSTALTITHGTFTPVTLDSELVDSHNWHSTSSNTSRYTPQQSGWYLVSGWAVKDTNWTDGNWAVCIFKNGAQLPGGTEYEGAAASLRESTPTRLVTMNGTTDYLEVQIFSTAAADHPLLVIGGASAGLDVLLTRRL